MIEVMKQYQELHLPDAVGSIGVVHCKWTHCSADDYVRARGKEQYASLAFKAISDNCQMIFSIAPVQFGSENHQHIVCLDPAVRDVRNEW